MAVSDRTMRWFVWAVAAALVGVFVYHVAALLGFLGGAEEALQEGLVWSIILMIFMPILAVAVIGGGLARTILHRRREAVERLLAEEEGEDGGSPPETEAPGDGGLDRPGA